MPISVIMPFDKNVKKVVKLTVNSFQALYVKKYPVIRAVFICSAKFMKGHRVIGMEDLVINVNILPEIICRLIRVDKVRVREVNGVVSLIPVDATTPVSDALVGLLKGSEIKSTNDIKNIRLEQ